MWLTSKTKCVWLVHVGKLLLHFVVVEFSYQMCIYWYFSKISHTICFFECTPVHAIISIRVLLSWIYKIVYAIFLQNIEEIKNKHKAKVPCFDFENFCRNGFKDLQVSEECGVVKYIKCIFRFFLVYIYIRILKDLHMNKVV